MSFEEQSQKFFLPFRNYNFWGLHLEVFPFTCTQILFILKPSIIFKTFSEEHSMRAFYLANKDSLLRNFQCNLPLSLKSNLLNSNQVRIKYLYPSNIFVHVFVQILKQDFLLRSWTTFLENILFITFQNPNEASLSIFIYTKYN